MARRGFPPAGGQPMAYKQPLQPFAELRGTGLPLYLFYCYQRWFQHEEKSVNYVLAVNVGNILTRVKVITSMGMEQRETTTLTFLAFCSTEPCSVDSPEPYFQTEIPKMVSDRI